MRTNCPVTVLFFQEDLRRCWPHVTRRACTGCSLFCRHLIAPPPSSTISAALNPAFSQCCHAIWCFLCRSFHAVSPRGSFLPFPVSPIRRRGNNLFYRRLSQICPVDTRPELIIILDLGARVVARNIF